MHQTDEKPWACTYRQIDWKAKCIGSQKLDYILYEFGFFFDAHRAYDDCLAVLRLLRQTLPVSRQTVLSALAKVAYEPTIRLSAVGSPFDMKDILKVRGYRWNPGDIGKPKAWYIDVDQNAA
ncbi:MAG: hypothetical protein GDA50_08560 [Alphaproteobacteria bacterium GM202ARS2]|nr:hypothetical protein [Alphaproteobacteria bacterium GM202ARS2]